MKTNNNLIINIINKWLDYSFNVSSTIITDNLIRISLFKFRSQILSSLSYYKPVSYPFSIKILILFKVKTINHQYRTITPLQIINIEDFNSLYELFIEF